VKHLTAVPEHDAYRIDSHYSPPSPVDYDRVTQTGPMRTDRMRCETRGMVGPAGEVDLLNGQTWRITWSLFVPSSLKGTSRFTHIMQMKYVDTKGGASGSPIVTLTLRPNDRAELLFWLGGGTIATVDMSTLHDKWLSSDLTIQIGTKGSVHWIFKDGDKVVVDKQQAGVTWPSDGARLRPKFGIYRGITTGVTTAYILLSDFKAYQCP
jgi:chitin-binding protein